MSSKRKIGKIIAGTLFTLFLSILVVFFSFAQITDYNRIKPSVTELVSKQLDAQKDQLLYIACGNSKTVELEIIGEKIVVDCGSGNLVSELAEKAFDSLYFKNYSCSIVDCLRRQETFTALFSAKANNFFNSYLLFLAALTLLSSIFLVYFLRRWGIPKGIGVSLLFVGINYFVLGFAKNSIPKELLSVAGPFITTIFDTIANNFLMVLIPGVILTVIGIAGKHFSKK